MVDVLFDSANEFMTVMDIASNLVEEAELVFDGDGMRMRSMDPSRVALIDFSIPSHSFEEYGVGSSGGESRRLGLNLGRFYKFLSRGSKSDSLRLRTTNNDSVLRIVLDNDRRRKSFRLPLRDIGGDEKEFPNLAHSASAVIREGELLSDVSIESDSVATYALTYLEDFFGGLSKGDEVGIGLGSDMPLLVSRDLYGGDLRFVLAPRIDEED